MCIAVAGFLGLFLFSCGQRESKNTEVLPSDSLKSAVAQSLDQFAADLIQNGIDTAQAFGMLQAFLDRNPAIYASALAIAPIISDKDTIRYSPYVYRSAQGYTSIYLEKSYDYTKDDWYTAPISQKKGCWTEPYFDQGGGNIWMVTYSVPLYTPDGALLGVITSDLEVKK